MRSELVRVITIGAEKYESRLYMTSKMVKLYAKLQRLVLAPIGEIAGAVGGSVLKDASKGILDANLDISAIGGAFDRLAKDLDPDLFLGLVKEILADTTKENAKPYSLEEEFQGQFLELMVFCKEVLDHNYGSFFAVVSAAVEKSGFLKRGNPKTKETAVPGTTTEKATTPGS